MWRNAGGLGLACVLLNYANGHITLTRLMVIYPPALAFYMLCHQRLLSTLIDKEIKGILFCLIRLEDPVMDGYLRAEMKNQNGNEKLTRLPP